ncbi:MULTISPECIES: glycoside hydrolase family 19 protein [unclassified Acinetobacter]|nr:MULTISPECIES: glycoside hydrolase family 19 protein [unclassified Acinetobacter]MDT0199062.1 glycoside hydrolase family 19 protein [Acinetobacter sp. RG5]MDT0230704.1 glycoside hydrolase family 19 protein [Acinetobacter sp. RRD8]
MMSNLVTITSKIYDASGKYVINLKVKSRYKGSSRENTNKTDKDGLFIFQGSPNRTVEILAKPPNVEDYIVIKTIDSSIISSRKNPVKVSLPKSIEEYHKEKVMPTTKGIVTTLFKIIDCNEKILTSFPVKSRPKGKQSSFERHTNEQGIVEVVSSPNRDIEILVLTSNDEFALKGAVNSEHGSQIPQIIKLDEPCENFKSESNIQLLDREGNSYIVENTKIEILYLGNKITKISNTSDGKFSFPSMIGEKIQITVFKPDGNPLEPKTHVVKRIKEDAIKMKLDVDLTVGRTVLNKPRIEKNLKISKCVCNRDISAEEFKKITTSATAISFLNDLNEQFKKLNMINCLEKAHFIAHTLHETASYSLLEEGLGGKSESEVYDGYKGRGLMQLTYKNNYELYGLAVNENFLGNNKHRIAKEKKHAVGSAVWYWHHSKAGNLSPHAINNDLIATCALINGGYNGFDDREKYYKRAVIALNIKTCLNLDKKIVDNLDNYTKFENSYIYFNKIGECFGWGLWSDPAGYKKGKLKNSNESKKGYSRFLEMCKDKDYPFGYKQDKKGNKVGRKRYGYSANSAITLAKKRLKEL